MIKNSETVKARALLRMPGKQVQSFAGNELSPHSQLPDFTEREAFVYAPFRGGETPYWMLDQVPDPSVVKRDINQWEAHLKDSQKFESTTEDAYRQSADKLLDPLRSGNLEKAVLSRLKVLEKPVGFTAVACFEQLCKKYPDAAVHLFASENREIWVGASPECLLNFSSPFIKTVSLAGTKPAETDSDWGEKEREEQALVTQFIEDVLQKNTHIHDMEVTGPETVLAGNVAHLKTQFTAHADDSFSWQQLIGELHPTPAIAGLPKEAALKAIEQCEPHQRFYYGGYLGTAQKNHAELYLNLRCMRIGKKYLQLYLGGGYTQASDVDAEWEETEHKAQTLLSVVENLRKFESS